MDRVDLTQAALEALQPSAVKTTKTVNQDEARSVRGKLLGVLIRKCRLEAERSLTECALFLGADLALIEAWEYGESVPSLPQLELLAQFLNGDESFSSDGAAVEDRAAQDEYMLLRRRLIGGLLRAARESSGRSVEELSESTGLRADQLTGFEFGDEKISVSDLTALAQTLKLDLSYFATPPYNLPEQSRSGNLLETPAEIDSDWREFAAESENLPFIQLAMAFQHIARDDLHRIADALFTIIRANGDSDGRSGSSS